MRFHYLNTGVLLGVGMLAFSAYGQAAKTAVGPQLRKISVNTQPDSIVWINGVRYGKTDAEGKIELKTTSGGIQTLRVRADGYNERSQPLTAALKGEVKIDLTRTNDEAELAYQEAERLTGADREKSAAAFRKAIKLRPNYPEAYLGLARVLSDSGDLEEALKAVISARKLRPGYAEASAVEGRIYKESGEEGKAIAAYKRALAEGKGFQPEAHAGLGLLYKEKAETAGGEADFEGEKAHYTESARNLKLAIKQLSGAPDCIIIYQLLGLIYEKQKRIADAIALYEEFLQIFPESAEATAVRSFIVQLKKQE